MIEIFFGAVELSERAKPPRQTREPSHAEYRQPQTPLPTSEGG